MKIRMLRDQPVPLPTGAVWYYAETEYDDVDEDIAASLIGRGYAVQVLNGHHNETLDRAALELMTVTELKKLAAGANVQNYKLLRKPDLIDALCPVDDEEKAAT